ncbi:hypothetical protein PLESTF_000716800 [Pleodorina starrii]|nr:hypothetical protein PLESTM_001711300 [Pleodorina starrii]GLC68629.1 hypothetical protein PLESTF_000716800 [Pleodorina starrii]
MMPQTDQQEHRPGAPTAAAVAVEAAPAQAALLPDPGPVTGEGPASGADPDWSWWWEQSFPPTAASGGANTPAAGSISPGKGGREEGQGAGTGEPGRACRPEEEEQEPPPPLLSVAPCGLRNPGYLPDGFLRRPYGLQLAWAAAIWRLTGRFPYPVVRQSRPPLMREGKMYDTALAEVEALLPLLVPEGENLAREGGRRAECAGGGGPPPTTEAAPPPPPPDAPFVVSVQPDSCAAACADGSDLSANPAVPRLASAAASAATSAPAAAGDVPQRCCAAPATAAAAAAVEALRRLLCSAPAVYLLLGFRLTSGSAARLVALPSLRECWEAFERRHAPLGNASVLTVGARALTKHTHRDLRGEWWPRMAGSEATKNQMARGSLRRLLAGALWLNVHQLPPFDAPKYVLEVRNAQGYGARWAVEDAPARDAKTQPPQPPQLPQPPLPEPDLGLTGPSVIGTGEALTAAAAAGAQGGLEGRDAERTGSADLAAALEAASSSAAVHLDAANPNDSAVATVTVEAGSTVSAASAAGSGAASTAGPAVVASCGVVQRPRVQFRGFLEPQMEGGHEAGWRH